MKGFGSSSSKTSSSSSAVETLIGRQTEILGDIRFAGGLHVDGKVKGDVSTQENGAGALWVSESGMIEGDVTVANVVLNGSVTGDVHASERLTLAAKARIIGNVHYKLLQMEPGAMVNGQLLYEGADRTAALTHQAGAEEPQHSDAVLNLHDHGRTKSA